MNKNDLEPGFIQIKDYYELWKDNFFLEMEKFSNEFITKNSDNLNYYSQKWVIDPFHQWARQWEYPFVYNQIQRYVSELPNNLKNYELNILDAGSGITFFPFFIDSNIPHSIIKCCDIDRNLGNIYDKINEISDIETNVEFFNYELQNLPFEDSFFDIIYCISVLEHTNNFEHIVNEFHRILKQNGLLIITFDVSLDNKSKLSIEESTKFLKILLKRFKAHYNPLLQFNEINMDYILSTKFIAKTNKDLLPPCNSYVKRFISILTNFLKYRIAKCFSFKTVYCIYLNKV